jgi:hypothetical protein
MMMINSFRGEGAYNWEDKHESRDDSRGDNRTGR